VPTSKSQRAICVEVIRLLQAEREARGLSKYAVAARSGVSQQMISYVERGMRNPTLEIMLRLADAVGVRLETLLKKARVTAKETQKR